MSLTIRKLFYYLGNFQYVRIIDSESCVILYEGDAILCTGFYDYFVSFINACNNTVNIYAFEDVIDD